MAVNVAKLIAKSFAKSGSDVGVKPATLLRVTPGIRAPGAASAGTNPTTQSFSAIGLVADYSAFELQNALVIAGDRKVLLFGASIASGAVPAPNDRVAIDGTTYTIVGPVLRDPVGATYVCQCRA